MSSRLPFLTLALLLATGCSNRERSNPFDPGNPSTQGRPVGFAALAGSGVVTLSWQPIASAGVFGYQAYRRGPGDAEFVPLGDVLPISRSQLPDFAVTNGAEYHYRLYYVFVGGPGGSPAEAAATPGTLRPWVTDYSAARLLRLTPDGRRVLFSVGGFESPTQVAVDPGNGLVWFSDTFADRVVIHDPGSGGSRFVNGFSRPAGVAVDPTTHTAWICDPGTNRVLHLGPLGEPAVPAALVGLFDPLAVAIDPNDRSVWVCEGLMHRVRRFDEAGNELLRVGVTSPSRLAIDSLTRVAWVTSLDQAQVVRVLPTGSVRDTLRGLQGPIGIDVDPRGGRAWICDPVANQVVVMDRAGNVLFRVQALPEVREVAVDRATGEAWVTVPGDGTVVKLSATGAVLRRLEGLSQPYAIALDPGVR